MSETGQAAPARPEKGAAAYRTIGEVAGDLDVPTHVLRFWESKFPQLRPLKRGGGRRYYRPEDVRLLHRIRQCLYQDGYTIRGVQKLLGDPGADDAPPTLYQAMPTLFPLDAAADPPSPAPGAPDRPAARRPRRRPPPPDNRSALEEIRRELAEARALLEELLRRPKAP